MNNSSRYLMATVLLAMCVATGCTAETPWNPPRPPDTVVPDTPFLKLPFVERSAQDLTVTQGWLTEVTEASIIGSDPPHSAVDFEGYPYGAPILAAADGVAWYSYERSVSLRPYTDPVNSRQIDFIDEGAGLFVEIAHDTLAGSPRWVTQYMHLSGVALGIPYQGTEPTQPINTPGGDIVNYIPVGVLRPTEEMVRVGVRVHQGQVIGWQGDTGIGANWVDNWSPEHKTVLPRDRSTMPPWDPQGAYGSVPPELVAQLHFGMYAGRDAAGKRQGRTDPFDLYAGADLGILPPYRYTNPYTNNVKGGKPYAGPANSRTAFIRDSRGNLLFAG